MDYTKDLRSKQYAFGVETNTYITEYIKFGDAKAGAVFAVASAIATAVVAKADELFHAVSDCRALHFFVAVIAGYCFLRLFLCAWFSLKALIPNVAGVKSLRSFPDIAALEVTDYVASVSKAESEQYLLEQILIHNAVLAKISQEKFKSIGISIKALQHAMISGASLLLVLFVAKLLGAA